MGWLRRIVAMIAANIVVAGGVTAHANPLETRSTSHRAISKVFAHKAIPSGRHGYILMDAETGIVLSARNADDLFIPASLAKIPTTLITLAALGTEKRFETRLVAEGTISNGILRGNLHLIGSGDPSLKTKDLVGLVRQLKQRGIKKVTGHFTYKADALPQTSAIDPYHSQGHLYNPAVSGLNIDFNIHHAAGKKLLLREPGRQAARLVRHIAKDYGIAMPEPKRIAANAFGIAVATHKSDSVSRIAKRMMEKSTNLSAEALGALAVRSMNGKPGSLRHAAQVTSNWLKSESGSIGGAGWTGLNLVNHSGLSTDSRATPRQIASILRLGYQRFGSTFTDMHKLSLPAGYRAFSMRGKFGTMRFVRGYAGFLTIGGRQMVFAIMTNDGHRRALADAGRTGLPSHVWMNRARRLEQSILSEWISDHWQPAPSGTVQVAAATPVTPSISTAHYVPTSAQPLVRESALTTLAMSTTTIPAARFVRATSPVD